MFGVNVSWIAGVGRFLQGAGAAFAFVAAVYLAAHGLPARYLATAIGITQCIGMLGGSAGQFVTAPLIHGPIPWQQFWFYSGIVTQIGRASCREGAESAGGAIIVSEKQG